MRISKTNLLKLIKEAVKESLSTRRAVSDQDIEDSFDLAYDEPISKQEKDWEAEQGALDQEDEMGMWALKMKRELGPEWEDIMQQDAIDKQLSKRQR